MRTDELRSGDARRSDDLEPDSGSTLSSRRRLYGATTAVLGIVVGLTLVEAAGWWHPYGVASATASDTGGGYELTVRYGSVSRPALATPLEIIVTRADGFDGPVTIAVNQRYLAMWDVNGVTPAPSGERSVGRWIEWEFDPPDGTVLTVIYDGRIEPARQSGRAGAVAVMDEGRVVAQVDFGTRVMP